MLILVVEAIWFLLIDTGHMLSCTRLLDSALNNVVCLMLMMYAYAECQNTTHIWQALAVNHESNSVCTKKNVWDEYIIGGAAISGDMFGESEGQQQRQQRCESTTEETSWRVCHDMLAEVLGAEDIYDSDNKVLEDDIDSISKDAFDVEWTLGKGWTLDKGWTPASGHVETTKCESPLLFKHPSMVSAVW